MTEIGIVTISRKSSDLITTYNNKSETQEEKINRFLDDILELRGFLNEKADIINELDEIFMVLTWADIINPEDEKNARYMIDSAKIFHGRLIRDYAFLNRTLKRNMFNTALKFLKNSIDDFEDSVLEAEDIIFDIRKDDELMSVINSL